MTEFASLESQDVREYWEHEERDFTPWLADQIRAETDSKLENTLELDLTVKEEEKSVGRYNVDILAEVVDDNRNVVIENQLGSSDHDHLGKSIAYASGVDADIIVWIAPRFYDEHRDAIHWLNENSREGVDLFAIRLEVWTIGGSDPAVRFNPVAEPSEWKEKAQRSDKELTDTQQLREEFWTALRDQIEARDTPLSPRKPPTSYYYNNPIGRSGFKLQFRIKVTENEAAVGLLIPDNPEAYFHLHEHQEAIANRFKRDLVWSDPEETRSGRERSEIMLTRRANIREKEEWDELIQWMIENGERFHDVFYDRLQQL